MVSASFQRCFACHSVDPDETASCKGPSSFQIMGRPAAAAIQVLTIRRPCGRQGAAGLVWDAATLDRYIADPDSVVAGTAMSVPPLRDAQERADLVAYLARSGPYRP